MQTVDEKLETIHLYVVREQEKKPFVVLPLLSALLCLFAIMGVTIYSAFHPYYEHETLRVPAVYLPLKTFQVRVPVIPTGSKTYPALPAHGTLTFTNGSVIAQTFPANMLFPGTGGIEVVTDTPVFIPPGDANGYGIAHVSAHSVVSGRVGNISAYAIDRVEGSSIYIRNLSPFTGGSDSYTVKVVTPQDKQRALDHARTVLAQSVHVKAILASPCIESVTVMNPSPSVGSSVVRWACQFVAYPTVPGMNITAVRLVGKNLFVDVLFVPRPRFIGVK